MTKVFSVRLDEKRTTKVEKFLFDLGRGKIDLVNHVIDNIDRLKPALTRLKRKKS
jgi:hypothetical protein